jgi:hypothetical protein
MQVGDRVGDRPRITPIVIPRTVITQEADDESAVSEDGRLVDRDEPRVSGGRTTLPNCCVGATVPSRGTVSDASSAAERLSCRALARYPVRR